MNQIILLSTEYITPSRTIELINLVNSRSSRLVYVYNFEGIHLRFFDSLISILQFFESGNEPEYSFTTEEDLDAFLKDFRVKGEAR
ncbi:hypothetical protein [Algoriphagus terrigena]|uniref:hypothetical protein n=1 Tax=Algoriphagus terrigena TaxID=344884 RepID=UPI00047A087A|nr:hypothetical protein [Algoriphagus terrigena]